VALITVWEREGEREIVASKLRLGDNRAVVEHLEDAPLHVVDLTTGVGQVRRARSAAVCT
jgi:hypothetical protein